MSHLWTVAGRTIHWLPPSDLYKWADLLMSTAKARKKPPSLSLPVLDTECKMVLWIPARKCDLAKLWPLEEAWAASKTCSTFLNFGKRVLPLLPLARSYLPPNLSDKAFPELVTGPQPTLLKLGNALYSQPSLSHSIATMWSFVHHSRHLYSDWPLPDSWCLCALLIMALPAKQGL